MIRTRFFRKLAHESAISRHSRKCSLFQPSKWHQTVFLAPIDERSTTSAIDIFDVFFDVSCLTTYGGSSAKQARLNETTCKNKTDNSHRKRDKFVTTKTENTTREFFEFPFFARIFATYGNCRRANFPARSLHWYFIRFVYMYEAFAESMYRVYVRQSTILHVLIWKSTFPRFAHKYSSSASVAARIRKRNLPGSKSCFFIYYF